MVPRAGRSSEMDGGHDRRDGSPHAGHATPSSAVEPSDRRECRAVGRDPGVRAVVGRKRRACPPPRKLLAGPAGPSATAEHLLAQRLYSRTHPVRVTGSSPAGDDGGMSAPQETGGDPARDAGTPHSVITAGLPSQLVDTDPDETQEWVDSLDAVIDHAGRTRARYLMLRMLQRSREQQVGVPSLRSTDYINTIPPEQEPWFPGDEFVEKRIR